MRFGKRKPPNKGIKFSGVSRLKGLSKNLDSLGFIFLKHYLKILFFSASRQFQLQNWRLLK